MQSIDETVFVLVPRFDKVVFVFAQSVDKIAPFHGAGMEHV